MERSDTLPLRNGPNCLDRHAAEQCMYNARVEHQPHVVDANGFRMRSLSDVFRHDCLIIGGVSICGGMARLLTSLLNTSGVTARRYPTFRPIIRPCYRKLVRDPKGAVCFSAFRLLIARATSNLIGFTELHDSPGRREL